MDEVFRFRPVTDSLLHLVSEDTMFNNVLVPKGIRSLFFVYFDIFRILNSFLLKRYDCPDIAFVDYA